MLKDNPLAKVEMPTDAEVQQFTQVISSKYPSLHDCWGAMDGLKLTLESCDDADMQNCFYNGWTHDHYVSNLFLFSPDGKIRACYLNAPGCWHDSSNANCSGIYDRIDEVYNRCEARVVVDSAFNKSGRDSLIKSHQGNMDVAGNIRQRQQLHREATSVRQLSEWGMRGLQGSFPRLKDRMRFEEKDERKVILNLVVLLYNFRASTVGLNQIRSSFMPNLDTNANNFVFDG